MSGPEITYRKANLSDSAMIKTFQLAMAWETEKLKLDEAILMQGVLAVFNSPELGQYFVCSQGDNLVGVLMVTKEWSDWRNGNVWWIQSVYFKPEFRGKGLFSKMYSYIQNLAKSDESARGIRLYVDHSNKNAQLIYAKIGMNGDHYRLFEWMKT
ncbi:MAG: GNAT family N-acetyltransferase [Oligoflexia bacterium]|nr:GNAT family N-acetyltransferase [Oligoflexia bacterium]